MQSIFSGTQTVYTKKFEKYAESAYNIGNAQTMWCWNIVEIRFINIITAKFA